MGFPAPFSLHLFWICIRFNLVGTVERGVKSIQRDYDHAKSYYSTDELLSDPDVELVVGNAPIDTHYQFAKQVLEAGKSTVAEKTFTSSASQALNLVSLARHKLVIFLI